MVILHFGFHTRPFHGPNYDSSENVLSTVHALLHVMAGAFYVLEENLPILHVI